MKQLSKIDVHLPQLSQN